MVTETGGFTVAVAYPDDAIVSDVPASFVAVAKARYLIPSLTSLVSTVYD